jgi:photosystem II stability/assembly factor-like uncharacterized protein
VAPFNRLTWRAVGPAIAGGRIAAVVGSARDPKLYYLGAAGGGVWKSTTGGLAWTPVFDKEHIASIGAIAIDPNDDKTVWVGTGETNPRNDVIEGGGVFRTRDGGKTWQPMGLAQTLAISKIVIDPHDSNRVVVATMGDFFKDSTDRGIYCTTDGGVTWQKTLYLGPQSGGSDLAVDPANFSVMYAGMWQFRRQPWTFTSGGPQDGLFKSTDGGATWKQITAHGFPEGIVGRIGLAVAPSDPKRIYALVESKDGILWRSDDAGTNWTLASRDTLVNQRPFYFSHVAVDPHNADHVYGISEMLSESTDDGKTFKEIADGVHVDFHSLWIAPNDPQRMIAGEDGGYALSLDGEKWSFFENLPIGQVYHVGYDDDTPYHLCAALQDNSAYCGPSDGLNPHGTPNRDWYGVVGGDGVWAVPDPSDPNLVYADSQDGSISLFDRRAHRRTRIKPWLGLAAESFDISRAKYRFNWNSPIAFSPTQPRRVWFGGNVVFQTDDRGASWHAISPDLTRNDKAHQQPAGGPLAFDVSGAEYTDTILDIEGSPLRAGEIWVGTDDGVVQITHDGGTHWRNVTPPNLLPDGRFETVAPSPLVAGTAYAIYDRHLLGDQSPYAFVTHDYGAHWTSIAGGLPQDQAARSIRPDVRNRHMVFAGLERSLQLSYDDGAHWQPFDLGMPPAPVYDIRIQPRSDDLLVATHGRGLYILDDALAVQELPLAQVSGARLFAPRPAYEYVRSDDHEGTYTIFYAKNPPSGAMLSFYQQSAGPAPVVRVYDATHRLIRTVSGDHCVDKKAVPFITNFAGLNRTTWDLREDGPVRWNGAAREKYKGSLTGPIVVPGTYTVEMDIAGRRFVQHVGVKPDPRANLRQADYLAGYRFARQTLEKYSKVDAALDRLDAMIAAEQKAGSAGADVLARAQTLRGELTADYHNDEDSIQRPGMLRENLEALGYMGGDPPSSALVARAARVNVEYGALMAEVRAFFAGQPAVAVPSAAPLDCSTDED